MTLDVIKGFVALALSMLAFGWRVNSKANDDRKKATEERAQAAREIAVMKARHEAVIKAQDDLITQFIQAATTGRTETKEALKSLTTSVSKLYGRIDDLKDEVHSTHVDTIERLSSLEGVVKSNGRRSK